LSGPARLESPQQRGQGKRACQDGACSGDGRYEGQEACVEYGAPVAGEGRNPQKKDAGGHGAIEAHHQGGVPQARPGDRDAPIERREPAEKEFGRYETNVFTIAGETDEEDDGKEKKIGGKDDEVLGLVLERRECTSEQDVSRVEDIKCFSQENARGIDADGKGEHGEADECHSVEQIPRWSFEYFWGELVK